jgi:hypothetical protein
MQDAGRQVEVLKLEGRRVFTAIMVLAVRRVRARSDANKRQSPLIGLEANLVYLHDFEQPKQYSLHARW